MQAQRTPTVTATAEVEIRVPRDGDTLERDAETVLERVDAVDRAEVDGLTGVTPTLNDLEVGATVRLTIRLDDAAEPAAATREALADGFGVREVSAVEVREPA